MEYLSYLHWYFNMNIKIIIYLFFIVLICINNNIAQSIKFEGIIVDSENHQSVSFPVITYNKQSRYADEKGYFLLESICLKDTIEIHCIGYKTNKFIYRGKLSDTIFLIKRLYTLPEIVISNNKKEATIDCIGKNFFSIGGYKGFEMAMFIPNKEKKKFIIEEVFLKVENPQKKTPLIRLHFYENLNGLPENELTQSNIISKTTSKGISFEVPNIFYLPTNGCFISIEWLIGEDLFKSNDHTGQTMMDYRDDNIKLCFCSMGKEIFVKENLINNHWDNLWENVTNAPLKNGRYPGFAISLKGYLTE